MNNRDELYDKYTDEVLNGNLSLKYVPEKYLTKDLCLRTLEKRPYEIEYIPINTLDKDMCDKLLSTILDSDYVDALLIKHIPEEFISADEWDDIVRAKPYMIKFLPRKQHTREIFLLAVTVDGMSLRYVPQNRQSIVICKAAVANNLFASIYVKDSLLHHICSENKGLTGEDSLDDYIEYYKQLLEKYKKHSNQPSYLDWDNKQTFETIISIAKQVIRESPEAINNNSTVIDYQRAVGLRYYIEKRYDVQTCLFLVTECTGYDINNKEIHQTFEFDTYHKFYKHLDGDMKNADLYEFDFKGVDITKIPLDDIRLSSDALYNLGMFDDTYYKSVTSNQINIESEYSSDKDIGDKDILEVGTLTNVKNEYMLSMCENQRQLNDSENPTRLYYISDIHLDHKIRERFPQRATKEEVEYYIEKIVTEMVGGINNTQSHLFVLGDVSSNFNLASIFYNILERCWRGGSIIAVLGNHELWGYGLEGEVSGHQDIIEKYRSMFTSLNITLLENSLIAIQWGITTYSESMLKEMTDKEINNIYASGKLLLFGGVGYSGYNQSFNASHHIYRDTVPTIEMDIELTKRFNSLYERVKNNLSDEKVFVLTHTPKQDWSDTTHNEKWIYMNGHTHQNTFIKTEEMVVCADNQIGYNSDEIELKMIEVDLGYDIFEHLSDGKYTISREEYIRFNICKGKDIAFNSVNGLIHMLKRNEIYMFFYLDNRNTRLYLLYGGRKISLDNQDMAYYYHNMVDYVDKVEYHMRSYYQALKQISHVVKEIGGSGRIHGCIIDIDFYNHIYLNPHDGKVSPYYAISTTDKDVYPDIPSLLREKRPDMLDRYLEIIQDNEMLQTISSTLKQEYDKGGLVRKVYDTSMYEPSNKILGLQYMTDKNIIRVWYDDILMYDVPEQHKIKY